MQVNEVELIQHVQASFHMDQEKHEQLLEIATMKVLTKIKTSLKSNTFFLQEEPYLKTNLEVHGARNLLGKDMTGQSDPFCTFYLTTNPHARLRLVVVDVFLRSLSMIFLI